MQKVISAKVLPEGVLVPRSLVSAWGDVQEVEIEQRAGTLVIKPKPNGTNELHERFVREMQAVGLVEDLPWEPPPVVPAEERARLAAKLGQGRPLSEFIIEERKDRA